MTSDYALWLGDIQEDEDELANETKIAFIEVGRIKKEHCSRSQMSKMFQEGGGNEPRSMLQEANKMRAEIVVGESDESRCCGVISRENRR